MNKGILYLIPVPLGATPTDAVLPRPVREQAALLQHFIAENAKSARAFLKALPSKTPLQKITITELNEHNAALGTHPRYLNHYYRGLMSAWFPKQAAQR